MSSLKKKDIERIEKNSDLKIPASVKENVESDDSVGNIDSKPPGLQGTLMDTALKFPKMMEELAKKVVDPGVSPLIPGKPDDPGPGSEEPKFSLKNAVFGGIASGVAFFGIAEIAKRVGFDSEDEEVEEFDEDQ